VAEAHLGAYDVVVTNEAGSATSASAALTFIDWVVAAGNYQGSLVRATAADAAGDFFPGRVSAVVSKTGRVTGKLEYMGLAHRFKAQFDVNLHAETTVTRRNDSPIALAFDLDAAANELEITATDSEVNGAALANAPRIPKRLKSAPAARAGRYTILLKPGATSPAELQASGFVAVNIGPTGTATWAGKLADASPVKGSALLTPADEVAFYTPLYVRQPLLAGHIAGSLTVDASGFAGDLGWRKPPQAKGDYLRGGIVTFLETESSPWIAGLRGVPVLPPGPITFRLENAASALEDFQGDFTALGKFFFPITPSVSPKLNLNRTTGLVTGSYLDTSTGRRRALHGAVLQNELRGEGFGAGVGAVRQWQLFRP
jgi:hypothetical protein